MSTIEERFKLRKRKDPVPFRDGYFVTLIDKFVMAVIYVAHSYRKIRNSFCIVKFTHITWNICLCCHRNVDINISAHDAFLEE